MKKTLKQKKIDQLIEWLEDDVMRSCELQGGYPDVVREIPGFVVIAGVMDDEPTLDVFTHEQCVEWFDDVQDYLEDNPDAETWEAVNETRPKDFEGVTE